MTDHPEEEEPVVVSAAEMRRAVGVAIEAVDKSAPRLSLAPVEQAAVMAQLGSAMRAMDAESRDIDPDLLVAPGHREASIIQSKVASGEDATSTLMALANGGYEIKFGTDDVFGWALSVIDWIKTKSHEQVPPRPGVIHQMPDDARIVVNGDWGTGLYGARDSAKTVANMAGPIFMMLHLGDVYYSGTPREIKDRFLKYWPKRPGTINRALNSNHEMYSGGYGYFDVTLRDFEQPSSYFAYRNKKWLIVGLDTGYVDHNLAPEQVAWLNDVIADSGQRKIVLFSHHQPFSTLERKGGKQLRLALQPLLQGRRIAAWYWGHEHRCVWYEKHPTWGLLGRCVGHGGIPYTRSAVSTAPLVYKRDDFGWRQFVANNDAPASLILDGPNTSIKVRGDKYGPHGYVVLRFQEDQIVEQVLLPDGTEVPPHD